MGMRVKDDTVQVGRLQPAMYWVLRVCEDVYSRFGVNDLVITSGHEDSTRHSHTSFHYAGAAVDLRTHTIPRPALRQVVSSIAGRLGRDFDVILEDEGRDNEHLHIELQPRRPN